MTSDKKASKKRCDGDKKKSIENTSGGGRKNNKKASLPFKPKQLLTPFSSHSPPSTLHAPSPSLDDKGNRLQTEHEYNCGSGNDANHPDELDVHLE